MIQISGGFEFHDLYIYPAPETTGGGPNKFYYFPIIPQPETDSQGHLSLLSIPTNQGGFLQLGAHLGRSSGEGELLEELRSELMVRMTVPSPAAAGATSGISSTDPSGATNTAEFSLEPAPLHVSEAKLQLGDGDENMPMVEDLAHSDTSGFYPYTALFAVQLNTEEQARATAALNGRPGFLLVRYEAGLPIPVQASARLVGDVREIIAELVASIRATPTDAPGAGASTAPAPGVPVGTSSAGQSAADLDELAATLLDKAIEQERVNVEKQSSDAAPQDLLQRAMDHARRRMLDLLVSEARREAQNPIAEAPSSKLDLARAETSANLTDSVEYPLSLVADVAAWFGGGPMKGTDHIVLLPGK